MLRDNRQVNVVLLEKLLLGDLRSLEAVIQSFKTRGYIYVKLPQQLIDRISSCMILMSYFFNQSPKYKKQYYKKPIFGYFEAQHKESYRLLTGDRLSEHNIPGYLEPLKELTKNLDRIMLQTTKELCRIIFKNIDNEKIPILNKTEKWGMFDVARYYNDGTRKDLNCLEHCDPGLISLSLRSSQPGLQLKNEFGEWVNPPNDHSIAILWTGDAAHYANKDIKPCLHRVANLSSLPRIVMWYEVCSAKQEHVELIDTKKKILADIESISGIPISKTR